MLHLPVLRLLGLVFTAILACCGVANAGDIRQTPLPNPQSNLQQSGYSVALAQAMLSGSRDDLWAVVPPSGWTNSTYTLKNKMYTALGSAGFDDPMANVIINMCKAYARDPRHCVIYASAVACAESSCAASWLAPSIQNNIFGLNVAGISYASRTLAAKNWIRDRYNQYWYTANEGYFNSYCQNSYYCGVGVDYDVFAFYSPNVAKPPTFYYCMSEVQPNGTTINGACPNGYTSARTAYLNLR